MLSFLTGPAESLRMRARAFPLRFSASASEYGSHRHPPPPNNSFKPTPCRGVGHVLCATLARVRRPATGRLNSGVRHHETDNRRMKIIRTIIRAVLLLAVVGCASTRYDSVISHAMTMCNLLNGPDAQKGEGEVWFWLQSERADASRKLWNSRGLIAVKARQSSTVNPSDRACLEQLHQEASTRQLMRE
jgi:hypothetical protein